MNFVSILIIVCFGCQLQSLLLRIWSPRKRPRGHFRNFEWPFSWFANWHRRASKWAGFYSSPAWSCLEEFGRCVLDRCPNRVCIYCHTTEDEHARKCAETSLKIHDKIEKYRWIEKKKTPSSFENMNVLVTTDTIDCFQTIPFEEAAIVDWIALQVVAAQKNRPAAAASQRKRVET